MRRLFNSHSVNAARIPTVHRLFCVPASRAMFPCRSCISAVPPRHGCIAVSKGKLCLEHILRKACAALFCPDDSVYGSIYGNPIPERRNVQRLCWFSYSPVFSCRSSAYCWRLHGRDGLPNRNSLCCSLYYFGTLRCRRRLCRCKCSAHKQ